MVLPTVKAEKDYANKEKKIKLKEEKTYKDTFVLRINVSQMVSKNTGL